MAFEFITDLHCSLRASSYVDAIFIDMPKAFNCLPHNRFLLKIRNIELDRNTNRWIKSFLSNSTQAVKIKNFYPKVCMPSLGYHEAQYWAPYYF